MRSFAITFVLAISLAAPASAQQGARRARAMFEEGVRAAAAEEWSEAVDRFRASFALIERPATAFNLAIALERLGRTEEASAALADYFRVAEEDDPRQADATALRDGIAARAPSVLTLTVDPESAIVEIDGQAREETGAERTYALTPGAHTITVRAEGRSTEVIQVDAAGGEPIARSVELTQQIAAASSNAPGASVDPLPWVVVGTSAALLIGGVVMLAIGRVDAATVENAPMGSPYADVREAAERSPILSGTGIALMAVGAIGAALGIVWAVQTPTRVEVSVVPGGVRGRF